MMKTLTLGLSLFFVGSVFAAGPHAAVSAKGGKRPINVVPKPQSKMAFEITMDTGGGDNFSSLKPEDSSQLQKVIAEQPEKEFILSYMGNFAKSGADLGDPSPINFDNYSRNDVCYKKALEETFSEIGKDSVKNLTIKDLVNLYLKKLKAAKIIYSLNFDLNRKDGNVIANLTYKFVDEKGKVVPIVPHDHNGKPLTGLEAEKQRGIQEFVFNQTTFDVKKASPDLNHRLFVDALIRDLRYLNIGFNSCVEHHEKMYKIEEVFNKIDELNKK